MLQAWTPGLKPIAYSVQLLAFSKLNMVVTRALGDDGQNLAKGWESIKDFIHKATNASTNSGKVAACIQKTGEAIDVFAERFSKTFLRHSGIKELKNHTCSQLKWRKVGSTFVLCVTWSMEKRKKRMSEDLI